MAKVLAKKIRVHGLVQGVGFRPTVWHLARQHNLVGTVLNDGKGVLLQVWGTEQNISNFLISIKDEKPPLSRIDAIECTSCPPDNPPDEFIIIASKSGSVTTSIIPDAATCAHCLDDIADHNNRRFRYPFTNCTHCGPRLSITRAIPYDRQNTSMASFDMCDKCQEEYDNPEDRRFHAQPNACPDCGPVVWLCDRQGKTLAPTISSDSISLAAQLVLQGHILAIKGIGGFHLCCDARNDEAVSTLRKRKKRYGKPLALMAASIAMVKDYADVSRLAEQTLESTAAPIVVLPKCQTENTISGQIAPDQTSLGFMLAYTPLHHLLVRQTNCPLVMTSGNVSNEPQVIDNEEALKQLSGIADFWLMHDRDIVNRLDDSVVQEIDGEICVLRRARGFAPATLQLPKGFEHAPAILAMGAELKNTFCLLKNAKATVSQHIGDLQDAAVHADYRKALELYHSANQFKPDRIAVDMHPGYFSSQWGEKIAAENDFPVDKIQHHHAHIAACLAEHNFPLDCKPVLGIALDGLGYGDNDALWGGEFLIAGYVSFERALNFQPVAIPGGGKASYEPWRNTFAHLDANLGWAQTQQQYSSLELIRFLDEKPLSQLKTMIERNLNAPEISSAGRLFDAVAGALNIYRETVSFEGQAAMALQAQAENYPHETLSYDADFGQSISWEPLWTGILNDLSKGVPAGQIAARFHNTLIDVIARAAIKITTEKKLETVVLSGGVFQNKLLCQGVSKTLKEQNLNILIPRQYPANDGGISLGQAVISAARAVS